MTDVADMTSEIKGGEGIVKSKVGCRVVNRSTVPEWYAGTSHRLQSGTRYLVGMQGRRTGCEQEYSTQLVHRDVAQVANRSTVPSWYTGVLYK